LSVVAPCYNEAGCLDQLHARLTQVCTKEIGKDDYEIVLVDDGSSDSTWRAIQALVEKDPHVVGIALSRNHGHQLALSAGLTVCRGQRILIIDADLQDPPELLPDMMGLMDQGADVVYGQRQSREGESWFKKVTAKLFYRLFDQLVDFDIPLDCGDFRLISRRALDVLNSMPEHHRFVRGMVSWIGFNQVPLYYERQARYAGSTSYPFTKMLRFAFDAITSFSVRPLRLASYLGMMFGLLSLAALIYTLIGWALGQTVVGWTSVMTVILLLGSAQLIVIGVVGEYLGRLCLEAKSRPLFIIDRIARSTEYLSSQSDIHEQIEAVQHANFIGSASSA
jgi:dolichol-phosphate mannosyltransferase